MSERNQFSIDDMECIGFDPSAAVPLLEKYDNLPSDRSDTLLEFLLAHINNFDVSDEDGTARASMTAIGVSEELIDAITDPKFEDNSCASVGLCWQYWLIDSVEGRYLGVKQKREELERKGKEEEFLRSVDVRKLDRRNVVATVNFNGPAPKVWHGCLVLTEEMKEEMKEEEMKKGEQSKL